MIITQLSAFIENKPGRLLAAVNTLAEAGIDIRALSLADTDEYGIVRLIVDKPEEARGVLKEAGIAAKLSHVVAVAMNDKPGGAVEILGVLSDADINLEYIYACVGHLSGKALMVIRTDDYEKTEKVLSENGFADVDPSDVYKL